MSHSRHLNLIVTESKGIVDYLYEKVSNWTSRPQLFRL
jgi:hypothetical protein